MSDSKKTTEGLISKNASAASIVFIVIGILTFISKNEQAVELAKYLLAIGAAFGVADIFRNRNINLQGNINHDVNQAGNLTVELGGKVSLRTSGPREKHTGSTIPPGGGGPRQKSTLFPFKVKCTDSHGAETGTEYDVYSGTIISGQNIPGTINSEVDVIFWTDPTLNNKVVEVEFL